MDLRHLITSDYQEAINLLPGVPSELRKALKTHQRVPIFVDNLFKQISRLPPHLKPTRLRIKQIVYDMTNVFVTNVKRQVDEKHLSDLAKAAEKKKAQDIKDLASTVDGNPQGDYQELSEERVIQLRERDGEDKTAGEETGSSET